MNTNGNLFIALLHSREPVGGPLLVVAHCASAARSWLQTVAEARAYAARVPRPGASCF